MPRHIASGDIVEQRPDEMVSYTFGSDDLGEPFVARVRPAGPGLELVAKTEQGTFTISGGLNGARYHLSFPDGQSCEVRVASTAPKALSVEPSQIVRPDSLIVLHPLDERIVAFKFPRQLLWGVVTITTVQKSGGTALSCDQVTHAGQYVVARLLGSTATLGDRYRLTAEGITTPSGEKLHVTADVLIQ